MNIESAWKRVGKRPHHGILVPLASIHSQMSSGIGEFLDLIPLIDWCESVHFDVLQLLPICDTGNDPSPYNPISSCALDPVYLSLTERIKPFGSSRWEIKRDKLEWLRGYFQKTFRSVSKTEEFRTFVEQNPWVQSYAAFKAEKEREGNEDFHIFLQYHCFAQMKEVKAYADKKGIFLHGDIPILLSPDSADALANPSLFRFDLVAGAPPDTYNHFGQKWGFPLWNWEAMEKEGFAWWKNRLKVAENFFSIYRIDHIVGFFRIWGIPPGKKAVEGGFIPSDEKLWWPRGKKILKMMTESTGMLPIGEDLGTIPKELYPILKQLQICGTKVVRWQRDWNQDGAFIPMKDYEPYSVTTVSTPDMDTLQLWWRYYPEEAIAWARMQKLEYRPELSKENRMALLKAAHSSASYFHVNLLQEYLALFPELVSSNPEEERINIPGTVLKTNWTHRFRPSVEEILSHEPLRRAVRALQPH